MVGKTIEVIGISLVSATKHLLYRASCPVTSSICRQGRLLLLRYGSVLCQLPEPGHCKSLVLLRRRLRGSLLVWTPWICIPRILDRLLGTAKPCESQSVVDFSILGVSPLLAMSRNFRVRENACGQFLLPSCSLFCRNCAICRARSSQYVATCIQI